MQTKLEVLMNKKKITDKDIVYLIDVSKHTVTQWLANKTSPRLLHALKLKNLFGKMCKIEDFLKTADAAKWEEHNK